MPPKRTANRQQKKMPYATDALESSVPRGVGSTTENPRFPTFRPAIDLLLAQNQSDPEILGSAQPEEAPMDEDDLILQPDAATTTTEEDTLLSLRRKYKRTTCNLAKVNSHLEFVKHCQLKKLTPRGLRVNIKCNALLADLTNVAHRFQETTTEAETQYLDALNEHYSTTTTKLETEKGDIETAMEDICRKSKNKRTVDQHKELLSKTQTNIEAKEKALETRKKRKLETMMEPPPPRTRRQQPQKGMMTKANRKTPQNATKATPNNSRPRTTSHTPTTRQPISNVHVNPNFASNTEPQVTTLLAGLLDHFSRGYSPLVQQQPQLHGWVTNAPSLQQPPLPGRGFLGWQQPSLSYPGMTGGPHIQHPGTQQNFG